MRVLRRFARAKALSVAVAGLTVLAVAATSAPATATAEQSARLFDELANWPSWQKDPIGTRHNPIENAITQQTVGGLKLKWAYTYANVPYATTGSQPAVVDGTLYVGAPDAKFLALDARTGATKWTFDLQAVAGPVDNVYNTNQVRDGAAVAGDKVYFGDSRGYLYALNKNTGVLAWATRLDAHPLVRLTGSPLVYGGRVVIGVSSNESGLNNNPAGYPCCTSRGQVVSVNAQTGAIQWRYYTVRPAVQVGTWPSGLPKSSPSGGAVWATPVVNPLNRTIYVGTGQNYTGAEGDVDTMLALNLDSGAVRWKRRMVFPDTYTVACENPETLEYCEGAANGTAKDFDFGATPNLIYANGRVLLGVGSKQGIYRTFDADTGATVWERRLNTADQDHGAGIEWGSSYDGTRIYAATWQADPGKLFALNPADGRILWTTPNPSDGCTTGGAAAFPEYCSLSLTPAPSTTRGLVYQGSTDGKFRVFASDTGRVLWSYDTIRDFPGVNGPVGRGSAVSGNGGAVISNGMVYVQSGYYPFYPSDKGHVLLAFGL